ncbi:biotin/lipoyl-binding protein, partial [Chromobacterium piscinae]
MKHQIEALRGFLQRYRQAFADHWSIRHQLDPKPRSEDELAFLPAHLELTDSPASPLPRWSMRVIVALFVCALLWALIGQLDIVAAAGGKTVSGGRTKIIQPLEPSVVKAIHVRDGQLVKAGQLLIELDATAAGADNRKAGDALETARLAGARYQALLAALDNGRLPQLEKLDGVDPAKQLSEEALAVGQWRAYQAKRDALQATLRQREAELSTTRQQVIKLQGTVRLAEAREHDYQELLDKNFISKHAYLDKQQARIEQQGDLASQKSRIQELAAAIASQREELEALTANFRSDALDKLREAREQTTQSGEEVKKTG